MIVKNEELNLPRCLNSVQNLFDEIIIVDTGSSDKTKEVALNFTDKIYDFKWINDFSAARNYAFSKAKMDYIMWLDADDVVSEKDLSKMFDLKRRLNDKVNIYMFKYNIAFDEKGNPTFSYDRERLIKNDVSNKWMDEVHEYIPLIGKIERLDIAINHHRKKEKASSRNINIYKEMKNKNKFFSPRNRYYFARELYDHQEYKEAIKEFKGFLDTKKGWIEDNINACILISNCYLYLKDDDNTLEYLLNTFKYDKPRRKVCTLIGNHYFNKKDLTMAIFWYIHSLIMPINTNGFYEKDYDEFIPYLNLSVCYYDKNYELAKYFHELAKKIKPENEKIIVNDKYFKLVEE